MNPIASALKNSLDQPLTKELKLKLVVDKIREEERERDKSRLLRLVHKQESKMAGGCTLGNEKATDVTICTMSDHNVDKLISAGDANEYNSKTVPLESSSDDSEEGNATNDVPDTADMSNNSNVNALVARNNNNIVIDDQERQVKSIVKTSESKSKRDTRVTFDESSLTPTDHKNSKTKKWKLFERRLKNKKNNEDSNSDRGDSSDSGSDVTFDCVQDEKPGTSKDENTISSKFDIGKTGLEDELMSQQTVRKEFLETNEASPLVDCQPDGGEPSQESTEGKPKKKKRLGKRFSIFSKHKNVEVKLLEDLPECQEEVEPCDEVSAWNCFPPDGTPTNTYQQYEGNDQFIATGPSQITIPEENEAESFVSPVEHKRKRSFFKFGRSKTSERLPSDETEKLLKEENQLEQGDGEAPKEVESNASLQHEIDLCEVPSDQSTDTDSRVTRRSFKFGRSKLADFGVQIEDVEKKQQEDRLRQMKEVFSAAQQEFTQIKDNLNSKISTLSMQLQERSEALNNAERDKYNIRQSLTGHIEALKLEAHEDEIFITQLKTELKKRESESLYYKKEMDATKKNFHQTLSTYLRQYCENAKSLSIASTTKNRNLKQEADLRNLVQERYRFAEQVEQLSGHNVSLEMHVEDLEMQLSDAVKLLSLYNTLGMDKTLNDIRFSELNKEGQKLLAFYRAHNGSENIMSRHRKMSSRSSLYDESIVRLQDAAGHPTKYHESTVSDDLLNASSLPKNQKALGRRRSLQDVAELNANNKE